MRIARFIDSTGQTRLGIPGENQTAALISGDLFSPGSETGERVEIRQLLSPVEPPNIFCIGLNYREHAEETGSPLPKNPVIFMKPNTALNHPGQPIVLPACSMHGPETDYEAELCVIIGKTARNVPLNEALGHVAGYTCANDVSARRWQKHGGGGQFVRGKGFDSFCPLGPVMVTSDEIPDPQTLALRCRVNGETLQDSNTSDMIYSVAELIAHISQDTTLLPGSVILTGTPPGVGFARDPAVFLKAGDQVEVDIEGIGVLSNPVVDAD